MQRLSKRQKPAKKSSAPTPSRRQLRHAAYVATWRGVDWTKQNIELAAERSLTPERIRQVRRLFGIPPSPRHGRQHTTRTALQWAQDNLQQLRGLTFDEVRQEFGRSINRCGPLYHFLKEQAVLRDGRIKHPWERMNFALPSRDLGRIWKLPFNMAASYRYRKRLGQPKWSFKGGRLRLPEGRHRRAYLRAVRAEERKARAWRA